MYNLKSLLKALVLVTCVITFSSCEKDLCENIYCAPNSNCIEGVCIEYETELGKEEEVNNLNNNTGSSEILNRVKISSLKLYLSENVLDHHWDKTCEDPTIWCFFAAADIQLQFRPKNQNLIRCREAAYTTVTNSDVTYTDMPISWENSFELYEQAYEVEVTDYDWVGCPDFMTSFNFSLNKNSSNPLIVTNSKSGQKLEIHWTP